MAERRAEETPLAPRRPLNRPSEESGSTGSKDAPRRPISERVSSAVSAAGTAVQKPVRGGLTSRGTPSAGKAEGSGATSASGKGATKPRGTRRARLRLVNLDPWSVMKTSFLLSIAFGIVLVVAVAVVWSVLGAAGVWTSINSTVTDVLGAESANTFDIEDYIGASRVLGFTMIVAVVDVILITAISTLAAFLYNLAAALLGGLEVTLAEDDA